MFRGRKNHPERLIASEGAAIELRGVSKQYGRGEQAVWALRDIDEAFVSGSFTAIMGPSGSGKSTLIHCAAGLDVPSAGQVLLGDVLLSALPEPRLTETRRREIGFIYQSFNLLPALTVRQNIELPVRLAGGSVDRVWLDQLVQAVGLAEQMRKRPAQLSGGQQQRVAIVRSLAAKPRVVFADEPTGALDTRTAGEILRLLREAVDRFGQTLIMVTHDPVAASYADRVLLLADGQVVDRLDDPTAELVAARLANLERPQ